MQVYNDPPCFALKLHYEKHSNGWHGFNVLVRRNSARPCPANTTAVFAYQTELDQNFGKVYVRI